MIEYENHKLCAPVPRWPAAHQNFWWMTVGHCHSDEWSSTVTESSELQIMSWLLSTQWLDSKESRYDTQWLSLKRLVTVTTWQMLFEFWLGLHAFHAFYAWWTYFPQSGALAEGTSESRPRWDTGTEPWIVMKIRDRRRSSASPDQHLEYYRDKSLNHGIMKVTCNMQWSYDISDACY